MRPIAIILLVLCLAAAGFTGYLYFNTAVTVTGTECAAVDAVDQAALFEQLKAQTGAGTFTGTPFRTEDIGQAADYQFLTYTVKLRNTTFLKAETAELQVTPMNGDVLQTAEETPTDIPARGQGEIRATILTKKDMHSVRELIITYYLWGLPFSTKVTYSP